VVLVVGVLVVTLVLGLGLISRLNAGQKVLDGAKPAFVAQRVGADRAGINFVAQDVDMADPIMTPQGGAASEVPQLIGFVSQKTGLSPAAVLSALQKNFPHTAALLEAIPLTSVTAELPGLLAFLEKTLHATQTELISALSTSFPAITQAITHLPAVTSGWNDVPGMAGATRFNGTPIKTAPNVRDYFSSDVIPVLETQHQHYEHLVSTSKINFIGPLVLIVGIVVILYGLLMVFFAMALEPTTRPAMAVAKPAT